MSNNQLSARLASLSPEQREALRKKLQQQKKSRKGSKTRQSIAPLNRNQQDRFPLSFAQQRLWFLDQLESGNGSYNIAAAVQLTGELDVEALRLALETIVQRHESLRTTFTQEGELPYQSAHPPGCWVLPMEDLSTLTDENRERILQQRINAEARTPFNLSTGPLLRTSLLRCTHNQCILIVVMHHIIADGWSTGILIRELSALYAAFKQGKPSPLPDLKAQYIDYSVWQRDFLQGDHLKKQLDYWRQQLDKVAILKLPTDFSRPPVQTYKGSHFTRRIEGQLLERLSRLSQSNGVTMYMAMLAAFQILLSRYTSQTDICVGSPIANRTRSEIEPLIGFFVNSLALRTDLSGDPSFSAVIKQVEQTTLDAYSNQDVPFEQLVDDLVEVRDASHNPLFQVFFSLADGRMERNLTLEGLETALINPNIESAKFDLSLNCTEFTDHLDCEFEYNTDLYELATIKRLSTHFLNLLECIVNNPELPLSQLELMDASERRQILRDWNETSAPITSCCVHDLIEEQARKTPGRIAVSCSDEQLTYAELNQQSNQLARYLIEQGVQIGDRIGICLHPSTDILVAILATLKSGAAYIPMDANYPPDRLLHMVENADIHVLLTQEDLRSRLPEVECQLVTLDTVKAKISHFDSTNPQLDIQPDQLLYVVYTSGSTGKPKGAGVQHRNEINLLDWYNDTYQISENDKVLIISAFGFDLTQKNLFAALTCGGQIVFPNSTHYDQQLNLRLIKEQQISFLNCAPSAFYPLVELNGNGTALNSLRIVLFGGESIRMESMQPWIDHEGFNCDIVNMYGPTECTDIAASHTINNPHDCIGKTIPIGRPNTNVQLYVLDEHNQPVPLGVIGELCIGGEGVGVGYLNNEPLTNERFFNNPFGNGKLYRTGDLVRYRNNGLLDFVSRVDGQVKIRGYRIELGEIEAQLAKHPAVRQAVVTAVTTDTGSTVLAAYCTTEEEQLPLHELRSQLKQTLPYYMVPSAIMAVDRIPLSPNGKVDRRALPNIDLQASSNANYEAPQTEIEKALVHIWEDLLQVDRVGIHDHFFEIGGHSLMATQLISRIRETLQIELPLRTLFEISTIMEIADILTTLQEASEMSFNMADESVLDDNDDFEEGVL